MTAVLGIGLAAALWWIYFDVVSLVTERRLLLADDVLVRNRLARDSYSYLHFPMVAGIVLAALGLEATIAHVDHALPVEEAFALLGGVAIYLLGHVALRWRNAHTLNRQRFGLAIVLLALVPLATEVSALDDARGRERPPVVDDRVRDVALRRPPVPPPPRPRSRPEAGPLGAERHDPANPEPS